MEKWIFLEKLKKRKAKEIGEKMGKNFFFRQKEREEKQKRILKNLIKIEMISKTNKQIFHFPLTMRRITGNQHVFIFDGFQCVEQLLQGSDAIPNAAVTKC